jgi:hypothetical protein
MRSILQRTITSERRETKRSVRVRSWVAVLSLVTGAVAQGPPGQVPTATYGPPACSVDAKPPAHSQNFERAHKEQIDGLLDAQALPSGEPLENFGVARYRLLEYGNCTGDTGCYWADLDAQYKRAETALAALIAKQKPGERLAIVMDIDETTLTNYCEMRREDFGYIATMYSAWETSPEAAVAIPGALRLFHQARAAGVDVFFITGRGGIPDYSAATPGRDETEATAKNLEAAGFHGWKALQLRNGGERLMPTIEYKSSERERIVQQGYRIVMSLGDQWSDLLGDPQAEVSVKLPNPFYFIP